MIEATGLEQHDDGERKPPGEKAVGGKAHGQQGKAWPVDGGRPVDSLRCGFFSGPAGKCGPMQGRADQQHERGIDQCRRAPAPLSLQKSRQRPDDRSEEHTSELQSLMRISYAVFCLKKKNNATEVINAEHIKTKAR